MSETARYLERQADLLEEQGHDVSAQVCRDAAKEFYAAQARLAALLEPGEYGDLPSRLLADAALCDVSKDEDAQGLRETMQLEIVAAAAIEQLQAKVREAEARLAVHEAERTAAVAEALERAARHLEEYSGEVSPDWFMTHASHEIRSLKPRSDLVCVPKEQVQTVLQAFSELHHAHTNPQWFTKGHSGANAQFRLWLDRGIVAAKAMRAAAKEGK